MDYRIEVKLSSCASKKKRGSSQHLVEKEVRDWEGWNAWLVLIKGCLAEVI